MCYERNVKYNNTMCGKMQIVYNKTMSLFISKG